MSSSKRYTLEYQVFENIKCEIKQLHKNAYVRIDIDAEGWERNKWVWFVDRDTNQTVLYLEVPEKDKGLFDTLFVDLHIMYSGFELLPKKIMALIEAYSKEPKVYAHIKYDENDL